MSKTTHLFIRCTTTHMEATAKRRPIVTEQIKQNNSYSKLLTWTEIKSKLDLTKNLYTTFLHRSTHEHIHIIYKNQLQNSHRFQIITNLFKLMIWNLIQKLNSKSICMLSRKDSLHHKDSRAFEFVFFCFFLQFYTYFRSFSIPNLDLKNLFIERPLESYTGDPIKILIFTQMPSVA